MYPYIHKIFSNCSPKPPKCKNHGCCEEEKECKYTGVPLACSDVDLTLPINDIIQILDNEICLLQQQVITLTEQLDECNNPPTTTTTTTVAPVTTTTTTTQVVEQTTTTTSTTEPEVTTTTTTVVEETTTTTTTVAEGSTTTTSTTVEESTTTTTTTSVPEETTTTTTAAPVCTSYTAEATDGPGSVIYTDCFGEPIQEDLIAGQSTAFCALEGTVSTSGTVTVAIIGLC